MEAALDPHLAGRVGMLTDAFKNVGSSPSNIDMRGSPEYVKRMGGRYLGSNKVGKKYFSAPQFSFLEAASLLNFKELFTKHAVDKMHPALKTGLSLLVGTDLQTGQPMRPSASRTEVERMAGLAGKKYLGPKGLKYLNVPGFDKYVKRDPNGNPYIASTGADGDLIALFIEAVDMGLPVAIINKWISSAEKVKRGSSDINTELRNLLGPGVESTVSYSQWGKEIQKSYRTKADASAGL
jgi:hypothetical protein